MNIPALEASIDCALVAATVNEKFEVQATLQLEEPRALARELAICVARILETADWNWNDLNALAVGTGPGSWTSLRIALSTFKTLSLVRNIPIVGVPTYDAVALAIQDHASTQEFLLAVTGRCRPGEIYSKLFVCDEKIEALTPEETSSPAELAGRLRETTVSRDLPIFVAGNATEMLTGELEKIGVAWQSVEIKTEEIAAAIAKIGAQKLQQESTSPLELLPLYVAASSAERVAAERMASERVAAEKTAPQSA